MFRPGMYPPQFPHIVKFGLYLTIRTLARIKFLRDSKKLPLRSYDFGLYLDIHVVSMLRLRRFPNLLNPSGYNDQVKWHMLFAQHEFMPICADKGAARDFIERHIGPGYLVPIVVKSQHWEHIEPHLRNGSGVLKCSHDSGSATFFSNPTEEEIEKLRQKFSTLISRPYGVGKGDWVYGVVEPCFLVEQILPGSGGREVPDDFKVHCVNGEPRLIHIIRSRQKNSSQAFFLPDGTQVYPRVKPHRDTIPGFDIEKSLDLTLPFVRKVAKYFRYVRVDLYLVDEQVYAGEISFFEESGLFADRREEKDLGDLIQMSCVNPLPTIHNQLIAAQKSREAL